MARIRSVKPEFWQDSRMAKELTRDQRLFYIGLWNEADDEGRFLAHPRRLLGAVFPYDRDLTESFIEDSLSRLENTDRVILYTIGGEPYGQLTKFSTHQHINRPTPSKIPPPPTTYNGSWSTHGGLTEDSLPEEDRGGGSGSGDGKGDDLDPLVPAQRVAPAHEEAASQIIIAANEGMSANPALRRQHNPIPTSHGSRSDVIEWLLAGVPAELAASVVRSTAETYRPSPRHRQISTMRYFTDRVMEAFDSSRYGNTNGQTDRPARRGNGRSADEKLIQHRQQIESIDLSRSRSVFADDGDD